MSVPLGSIAGNVEPQGYVIIRYKGKAYKAHRLAWLYIKGIWPVGLIDHKNGVKSDNWIDNLHDVTSVVNSQNRRKAKNRAVGVMWWKRDSKYQAHIRHGGKNMYLGRYEDWWNAICARKSAEASLGWEK